MRNVGLSCARPYSSITPIPASVSPRGSATFQHSPSPPILRLAFRPCLPLLLLRSPQRDFRRPETLCQDVDFRRGVSSPLIRSSHPTPPSRSTDQRPPRAQWRTSRYVMSTISLAVPAQPHVAYLSHWHASWKSSELPRAEYQPRSSWPQAGVRPDVCSADSAALVAMAACTLHGWGRLSTRTSGRLPTISPSPTCCKVHGSWVCLAPRPAVPLGALATPWAWIRHG